VYSNQNEVTLYKDGSPVETKSGHTVFTFQIPITGEHTIEAHAEGCKNSVILVRKAEKENPDYVFVKQSPVTNWFDGELDETCYSVNDKVSDIRRNPEAGAVVDAMIAEGAASRGDVADSVKDNPALQRMIGRITMVSLMKQSGADEESIKQINRVLQQYKKA
jgi:beta-galactosidase